MKRSIFSAVVSLILISNIVFVYANSGPVIWPAAPSSDIVAVEESSPIEVRNELLTFDFNDAKNSSYSISGKVTAEYEMYNPTDEKETSVMAFPFVESVSGFSEDAVSIMEDDDTLPFEVYIGSRIDSIGNNNEELQEGIYDFNEIVGTIKRDKYVPHNFSEDETGKLYKIYAEPKENNATLSVEFNYDSAHTKVMTKGFNSFSVNGENIRVAAGLWKPEVLEIFILGEDVDLVFEKYKDGTLTEKTDLLHYEIISEDIMLKDYLKQYTEVDDNDNYNFNEIQLYNMYARALDRAFTNNMGFCSEDMLSEEWYNKRILILVYTVEFPENSTKTVSVSYTASGTMDRRETNTPQYTFDYILNPAENWNAFKNLNIKIIAPDEAPYIIKSSVGLNREDNNIYSATLNSLPGQDLSFTLYYKEKISLLDRVDLYKASIIGFLVLIIGTVAAIFFIAFRLIKGVAENLKR